MAHIHTETSTTPAGPLALHGLSVEGVNQCVHCGLCLAYCPTFSELGTEMDSPRGRIFTIKSLAEGRMSLTEDRKSTRLNSSHRCTSYAVFCLNKKNTTTHSDPNRSARLTHDD